MDINNQSLGSMIMFDANDLNYIDNNLVEIAYCHNFGLNGSKRRSDGTPRKCRWYSPSTYEFVKNNDLDKLDDLSDTILIILAVRE